MLKWLFYRLGWKVDGAMPQFKKYIIIVGPHTSGWDFVVGLMARSALGLQAAKFLGKSQLFKPPFGWFFRMLGGTPVDRSSPHDVVDQVVSIFNSHDSYILALAPEGTRRRVDKLRTGFYYIAVKAGVPIVPVGFDFGTKKIVIAQPFFPTGDLDRDMEFLIKFFSTIKGKIPEDGIGWKSS